MLILTRKLNDTLIIGDAVLHIYGIENGRVKLGIDAPSDVIITRGELLDRVNIQSSRDLDRQMPEKWPLEPGVVSDTGLTGKVPRIGL